MSSILPGTTRGPTYAKLFKKGASLRLLGGTSGYVDLVSPAAPTSYTLTLPTALPGVTGYVLSCTDAGVLSWVAQPAASSPAGSGTEIQYRNGSAFGAVAGSSWNGSVLAVTNLLTVGSLQTVFGGTASALGNNGIAIGYGASANGQTSLACGYAATAGHLGCVCLGYGANSAAANQFVCGGGYGYYISDVYFGGTADSSAASTVAVSPVNVRIQSIGASGTNAVGSNFTIAPGPSTGNGTPSSVIIQSSVAGSSGSTAQTLADTLTVTNGRVGINVSPAYAFHSNTTARIGYMLIGDVGYGEGSPGIKYWNAGEYALYQSVNGAYTCINVSSSGGGHIGFRVNNVDKAVLNSATGRFGFLTTAPDRQVEINATDGNCLRLTYNDANGSAANYSDFAVSSGGNLTITPSGGIAYLTGNLEPFTDDTYYLGRNDDDTPKAWKGVVLKDTTNGKYYRLEIISGVVTATDLTD